MRIPQSGLRLDSPAWPLLQAHLSYWGTTSAAGNALGTTLVCADLANWPTLVGMPVKILTGAAQGQIRQIAVDDGAGTLTVASAFTNAAGAVQQIVAGINFCILSAIGGGAGPTPPPPPGPGVGLWMFGECAPDMVGSTVTVRCPNLAGLGDDLFNTEFYMQVIHNANAPGVAPETEVRQITDYVSAPGTFTVNAFTANVEANDCVCVFHELIWLPSLLIQNIFDMVNAILTLTETGGTRNTTVINTEYDLYINDNPVGVYNPRKLMVDFSNQLQGDTVRIRVRYRIVNGGGMLLKDELVFAGVQAPVLRNIELEPTRFGIEVTIERLAGAAQDYIWSAFFENL